MSTEALNLDQAVEKFLAPEEPASSDDAELDSAADSLIENTEEETDVDSEVDNSEYDEEYDEEYDTEDESAEADDEPDQVGPEKIIVKVDGEEVSVTLEDLKRSYSGQGKIQKGMQEAAEVRKQAQAVFQQANAMAQELSAVYQQIQRGGIVSPPVEPSRELFDTDPIGYMEAKMDYDNNLKAYQAQMQQMQQVAQYQEQQQQYAQQQRLASEIEILKEKIPELRDAKKASEFRDSVVQAADEYGYAIDEISSVADHRHFLVLRDALRWRQSQAKRSQVERKANGARPVIKPQAKRTADPKRKQAQQSKSKLKKTGSIDDALSLIMNS